MNKRKLSHQQQSERQPVSTVSPNELKTFIAIDGLQNKYTIRKPPSNYQLESFATMAQTQSTFQTKQTTFPPQGY
jgi:hypothetical protein